MSGPISQTQPGCHPTFEFPPICQPGTQHCNSTLGGGCCPLGTTCAAEGCTDVIEFVYPRPEATSTLPTAACEELGCEERLEFTVTSLLPTGSAVPDPGVTPATGTGMLQPATWTVTVTGSKTGEICNPSAMATAGVASGAARRATVLGPRINCSLGDWFMLSVLMAEFLVLAVDVLF